MEASIERLKCPSESFKGVNEIYVCHFEEDFCSWNPKWFNDIYTLLNDKNENYVYVGESTTRVSIRGKTGLLHTGNHDGRGSKLFKKYNKHLCLPEVWTDGGFYSSTLTKLKIIEDKIGIFHKGDQNSKFIKRKDGIDIGEVGFPSLIHSSNLVFTALFRNRYFTHYK